MSMNKWNKHLIFLFPDPKISQGLITGIFHWGSMTQSYHGNTITTCLLLPCSPLLYRYKVGLCISIVNWNVKFSAFVSRSVQLINSNPTILKPFWFIVSSMVTSLDCLRLKSISEYCICVRPKYICNFLWNNSWRRAKTHHHNLHFQTIRV